MRGRTASRARVSRISVQQAGPLQDEADDGAGLGQVCQYVVGDQDGSFCVPHGECQADHPPDLALPGTAQTVFAGECTCLCQRQLFPVQDPVGHRSSRRA
ncbi:hypothetical protein QFZ24_001286 [Streptomyces phaeochromogenes]|nr:hypothetical protein [Streptomyces phaeochromogenes]